MTTTFGPEASAARARAHYGQLGTVPVVNELFLQQLPAPLSTTSTPLSPSVFAITRLPLEPASMETHELEYMYDAAGTYHFMNTENYDQLEMDEETLGDNAQWMQPGMKIQAEYYNGRPIGIELPNSMVLEVVDTAAVMKTATKNASSKPAKLENGVTINVPEFIRTGEKVRVNPNTGEYMDRAKE